MQIRRSFSHANVTHHSSLTHPFIQLYVHVLILPRTERRTDRGRSRSRSIASRMAFCFASSALRFCMRARQHVFRHTLKTGWPRPSEPTPFCSVIAAQRSPFPPPAKSESVGSHFFAPSAPVWSGTTAPPASRCLSTGAWTGH